MLYLDFVESSIGELKIKTSFNLYCFLKDAKSLEHVSGQLTQAGLMIKGGRTTARFVLTRINLFSAEQLLILYNIEFYRLLLKFNSITNLGHIS